MAKCAICGKSILFGNKVSHSHKRSNKMFRPNIKRVKIQTEKGNKRVYICTSCLRSGLVKRAVYTPKPVLSATDASVSSATDTLLNVNSTQSIDSKPDVNPVSNIDSSVAVNPVESIGSQTSDAGV